MCDANTGDTALRAFAKSVPLVRKIIEWAPR